MRSIVIGFAILACIKVWTQDRMYRAIMSDALIQAYRERAQQMCVKESAKVAKLSAVAWPSAAAEITIGSKAANVSLWDYENPKWDVRYRHPNLVLTSSSHHMLQCNFDIVAGIAAISMP